jgi:hypothetical protein
MTALPSCEARNHCATKLSASQHRCASGTQNPSPSLWRVLNTVSTPDDTLSCQRHSGGSVGVWQALLVGEGRLPTLGSLKTTLPFQR